jgi:hypothetical protein
VSDRGEQTYQGRKLGDGDRPGEELTTTFPSLRSRCFWFTHWMWFPSDPDALYAVDSGLDAGLQLFCLASSLVTDRSGKRSLECGSLHWQPLQPCTDQRDSEHLPAREPQDCLKNPAGTG